MANATAAAKLRPHTRMTRNWWNPQVSVPTDVGATGRLLDIPRDVNGHALILGNKQTAAERRLSDAPTLPKCRATAPIKLPQFRQS